jgi:hypothetical protein
MKLTKQERERRIFEELAQLAGLQVAPDSISQPDPPDIVCEIVAHGPLAVELVAIDAPETRSRLDNMSTTDEAWSRALTAWPTKSQARLLGETVDVFFSVVFSNKAGARDRTKALRAIQEFLLQHPGHTGVVPPEVVGRHLGVTSATIHRGHVTRGPKFSHFSTGPWLPPQVSKVAEKLRPGRYERSDIPMELFAYAIHDEPDLSVGSLEQLQNVIVERLPGSVFRRARVFDLGLRRHLYSYPPDERTKKARI